MLTRTGRTALVCGKTVFVCRSVAECAVIVSAKKGGGIELLIESIEEIIRESKRECNILVPYSHQSLVSEIYNEYSVKSVDYLDDGIAVIATLDEKGLGRFKNYIK